ncbi:MAG: hypothetical protein QG608_3117 [Actinomycetota bacterium]|nr:hypothetical protein [Actinomycetota bacterium]
MVARITRPGMTSTATKEVQVSRWLDTRGFPVVQALPDVPNPVRIGDRDVSFWHEFTEHRPGTSAEIGALLRRLHTISADDLDLPDTDPFVQVEERIATLDFLDATDRTWMLDRATQLRHAYAALPPGLPRRLVHGDPWSGNVVITCDGPLLIDLERVSVGPPEYDLVVVAAAHTSYGTMSARDYGLLVDAYGHDVTAWEGYPVLRDIRELRVTTYAGQVALDHPDVLPQAVHRLRCLQGHHGHRPWTGWRAVP